MCEVCEDKITQGTQTMTTATATIRRNADGQQNLTDLRKALAASQHMVHRQGGNWIMQQWSESHNAYLETPAPHWMSERQAIQTVLFGESESPDEAKFRVGR
jgi:hypothetical protein